MRTGEHTNYGENIHLSPRYIFYLNCNMRVN